MDTNEIKTEYTNDKMKLIKVSSSQQQVDNAMDAVKSAAERIEEMRELLRRSYRSILWLNGQRHHRHKAVELRPYMKKHIEEIKKLKSDLEEDLGEEPQKKGVLKNGS